VFIKRLSPECSAACLRYIKHLQKGNLGEQKWQCGGQMWQKNGNCPQALFICAELTDTCA
jgi:hypothetical protein